MRERELLPGFFQAISCWYLCLLAPTKKAIVVIRSFRGRVRPDFFLARVARRRQYTASLLESKALLLMIYILPHLEDPKQKRLMVYSLLWATQDLYIINP